jgi:hypothetical protein
VTREGPASHASWGGGRFPGALRVPWPVRSPRARWPLVWPKAALNDQYNMEATQDGLRTVPFHGQNQAGTATPPQTAASFLAST